MNYMSLFDVLRKGESVADPATWKNRAAVAMAVSGIIVAASHAFPQLAQYGIDQSTADGIGATVAFLAGVFGIYGTSEKVGLLPPKAKSDPAPQDDLRNTP